MKSDNLPKGWMWTRLEEIVNEIEKVNLKETPNKEFIYLDIASIDNSQQRITHPKKYLGKDAPSRAKQLVKTGDILFSSVRTYLKNIATVNETYNNQIASTGFCVLRPNKQINERLIFYLVQTNFFLNPLTQIQRGTNYPAVRESDILDQIVPLPPIPEQRSIASKIEQLFSDLDNGIENFKKAQAQLKLYRQSVLKAACEGKLVPNEAELARSEGRKYEAADVLLARILKERREKWKGKGKYKEPASPIIKAPKLPEGWCCVTFDQIGKWSGGGTPSTDNSLYWVNGNIPWISPKDMKRLKIHETEDKITDLALENSSANLIPASSILFVVRSGILKRTLPVALTMVDAAVNQDIKSLTPHAPIDANYLLVTALAFNETIRYSCAKAGTTVESIEVPALQMYAIPLPPLTEQRRIVAEVERRLSVCDKMEATITESLIKTESLRQSILKKAFEGKLLNKKELEKARNAPDWEPAEKLLERIRQEKQIKEKNNKPTRKEIHG